MRKARREVHTSEITIVGFLNWVGSLGDNLPADNKLSSLSADGT